MQWSFNFVSGATSAPTTPTTGGGCRTWSNTADGFASTGGGTTGGAGGPTVTVTTYADLLKYATSSSPYVVKVAATIAVPQYGYEIPVTSDKTLIGVGNFDYDGIQLDTADHVWIDHNTFTNVNDGYIDSRKDTSYVTVSWNVMGNHNKTFGIGWTDNVTARIT